MINKYGMSIFMGTPASWQEDGFVTNSKMCQASKLQIPAKKIIGRRGGVKKGTFTESKWLGFNRRSDGGFGTWLART